MTPVPESNTRSGQRAARWLFGSVGVIITVCFLVFAGLFFFYLRQIKYGDPEQVRKLSDAFRAPAFTLADSGKEQKTRTDSDISSFVRPHNPTFGNPDAPITILAFIDFECPFCQAGYPVFKQVSETYASGARIVFKHLPIAALHPHAFAAANAAACAQEQKAFWPYYDALFEYKTLDTDGLIRLASNIGLDMQKFNACLSGEKYRSHIEQDMLDAVELDVRGTPTYFINRDILEGVHDRQTWDEVMLRNLRAQIR